MSEILRQLAETIESRKLSKAEDSYVAGLCSQGRDAILKKVGEEATEVILAAGSGNSAAVVHEVADLWFHTLVLLADCGLRPEDVFVELERRFGISGLAEKRSRATRR